MRSTSFKIAAATALATVPAAGMATPLRAGGSLPTASVADGVSAARAATPVANESDLAGGLSIFAVLGIVAVIGIIVIAASSGGGDGRSPG